MSSVRSSNSTLPPPDTPGPAPLTVTVRPRPEARPGRGPARCTAAAMTGMRLHLDSDSWYVSWSYRYIAGMNRPRISFFICYDIIVRYSSKSLKLELEWLGWRHVRRRATVTATSLATSSTKFPSLGQACECWVIVDCDFPNQKRKGQL